METARYYGQPTEREQTVTSAPTWACRPQSTERGISTDIRRGSCLRRKPALETQRAAQRGDGTPTGKASQDERLQNRGLKGESLARRKCTFPSWKVQLSGEGEQGIRGGCLRKKVKCCSEGQGRRSEEEEAERARLSSQQSSDCEATMKWKLSFESKKTKTYTHTYTCM